MVCPRPSGLLSIALLPVVLAPCGEPASAAPGDGWRVVRTSIVGEAWSGHPVHFAFGVREGREFVAWYDGERSLVVAGREEGASEWTRRRLDESVGWDSHDGIAMALDARGILHLCANMHSSRLNYWRSARPLDATSLTRIPRMVGRDEDRCTYPRFLAGEGGRLLFLYRDGESGDGRQLVNAWDAGAGRWRRALEKPLLSGGTAERKRSAYPWGPVADRDGTLHMSWVWRETPDCATNRDLCYARSGDGARWTDAAGRLVELPLDPDDATVVVDPVPVRGGLANFGGGLGFDARDRPVLTYLKFDDAGHSQVFAARFEDGEWVRRRLTDWTYRWFFRGGGSIEREIRHGPLTLEEDGKTMRLVYRHAREGGEERVLRFDAGSLKPLGPARPWNPWPAEVSRVRSEHPGLEVQVLEGPARRVGDRLVRRVLRWETLPPNRDRPRMDVPPPSPLELLELERSD